MAIEAAALAPAKFAEWMCSHQHHDPKFGHVYNYPRGSPKTGHRGSLQNRPTINR